MKQLPAMLTRLAGGQGGEMRAAGAAGRSAAGKDGGVGSLVVGGRSNLLELPGIRRCGSREGTAQRA